MFRTNMDRRAVKKADDVHDADPPVSVRPRSTHRKQRSDQPKRAPLAPTQDRSRRRNDEILQAAIELLQTVNIEDLSHSDIGERAGISKAAVYYHYPTIAALQHELGLRFDRQVSEYQNSLAIDDGSRGWQELLALGIRRTRDWFNDNRPVCEVLLGPRMTRENQMLSAEINSRVGQSVLDGLRARYHLPEHPDLEEIISYHGEIVDLFWSRSYLRVGFIDDHHLEESLRASVGYLKNYFPEHMARRKPEADR